MQKLAQNEPDLLRAQAASSGSTDLMRQHMDAYEQRLATCTSPMLQYEWAWLEDHISSLELCLSQPEMLATAGGKHQVEEHLLESQRCQEALLTLMRKRGVDPSRHGHAVVIGEHAWEISQASIRGCWGID